VTSHCPSFTLSYVTLDSEFKPKDVMASPARDTVAKGMVAAPTRYLDCQYLSDIWLPDLPASRVIAGSFLLSSQKSKKNNQ